MDSDAFEHERLPLGRIKRVMPQSRRGRFRRAIEHAREALSQESGGRDLAQRLLEAFHELRSESLATKMLEELHDFSIFLVGQIADVNSDKNAERFFLELFSSLGAYANRPELQRTAIHLQANITEVVLQVFEQENASLRVGGEPQYGRLAVLIALLFNAIIFDEQKSRVLRMFDDLAYEAPASYRHPIIEDLLIKLKRAQSARESERVTDYTHSTQTRGKSTSFKFGFQ